MLSSGGGFDIDWLVNDAEDARPGDRTFSSSLCRAPMYLHSRIGVFVVACCLQLVALRVNGEEPQAASSPAVASPIKQASFTHAAAGDDAKQTIHFGRQAARVGDRIEQN